MRQSPSNTTNNIIVRRRAIEKYKVMVWLGIDLNDLPDILKIDIDESSQSIIHPVTRQKVELPPVDLRDKIFSFLVSYRDADSCDTRKFGGRVLPYMQSKYLLRSYKNAHLTVIQLRKTSDPVNQLAKIKNHKEFFNGIKFTCLACIIVSINMKSSMVQ